MSFSKSLFMTALMGVIVSLVIAAPSFARSNTSTLQAFIPGGISATNANKAFETVMARAAVDSTTAKAFAQAGGSSTFKASAYEVVGYHHGAPGVNSGIASDGSIVPTSDDIRCDATSLTLVIKDLRTQHLIYVCVPCGNLRLNVRQIHQAVELHKFVKGTTVLVSQPFTRTYTKYCQPNKQQKVTVTVTTWVHGLIKASSWGKAQKLVGVRINATFTPKINQTVKIKCGKATPPPPPPPTGSCNVTITGGVVNGNINNCSSFTTTVICGNLTQTFNGSSATDVASQAQAWQKNNCNTTTTTTPTPTCTPPTTGTYPNCVVPQCPSGQVGVPPNCSTPKPVSHSCTPDVSSLQKDERTATFTVSCDGPVSSASWTFSGNGRTATGTSVDNTFPDSSAGGSGTGTVTVLFSDGAPAWTGSVSINIPATPPTGDPGTPTQPPTY